MNQTRQNLEDGLFEAALQKPSPAERSAFLDGACRDNPALRITDFVDEKITYTSGHLALQQFGTAAFPALVSPGPVITFRNVMVKPLPDDALAAWAEAKKDLPEIQ